METGRCWSPPLGFYMDEFLFQKIIDLLPDLVYAKDVNGRLLVSFSSFDAPNFTLVTQFGIDVVDHGKDKERTEIKQFFRHSQILNDGLWIRASISLKVEESK